ncbi:hypothetical protein [Phocaeicola sp.]|uniref:hypothetical protein n=1 Tax=Phocaeicola sp. TaxID=2773926 RepID=UPI003AB44873
MKYLKIRFLVYVAVAIALCCLMEGAGLIIAMTLMVMVMLMDWAGTSWYTLTRKAEAGDEKSRLKLEKVKKVVDNLWLNLSVFFLLWGIFALITHCSGKAFIGVTAFCVLGAALTVYNHVNKKKNHELARTSKQ